MDQVNFPPLLAQPGGFGNRLITSSQLRPMVQLPPTSIMQQSYVLLDEFDPTVGFKFK